MSKVQTFTDDDFEFEDQSKKNAQSESSIGKG